MKDSYLVVVINAVHTANLTSEEVAGIIGSWIGLLPEQFRSIHTDTVQGERASVHVEQAIACTYIPGKDVISQ